MCRIHKEQLKQIEVLYKYWVAKMEKNYKKKNWRVIEIIKRFCHKFDIIWQSKMMNWPVRTLKHGRKKSEFAIWFTFLVLLPAGVTHLFITAFVTASVAVVAIRSNSATSCVNWCDLMRKFTAIERLPTANNYLLSNKLFCCVRVWLRWRSFVVDTVAGQFIFGGSNTNIEMCVLFRLEEKCCMV